VSRFQSAFTTVSHTSGTKRAYISPRNWPERPLFSAEGLDVLSSQPQPLLDRSSKIKANHFHAFFPEVNDPGTNNKTSLGRFKNLALPAQSKQDIFSEKSDLGLGVESATCASRTGAEFLSCTVVYLVGPPSGF